MNTKAGFLLILAVFFQIALVQSALAQSLKMSVAENGEAALWRASSGQKEQIKDSVEIGFGDTLFTLADADARVWLESQSTLLVKGGSVIVLNGKESSIDISLEDGQVFFDRNQPHELTSLRILTKGYSFTPTGTAAAVKTTRQGLPTVAVLRGSVLMASSQGGSVSVEARQFGTVNSAGVPVSGSLNEKGLQQLEAWSGVKAEAAADQNVNAQEQDAPDSNNETPAAATETINAGDLQAQSEDKPANTEQAVPIKKESAGKDEKTGTPLFSSPSFELSAGVTSVNDEMWTRVALGMDVPIWRFGVFFDFELFIDPESKVSNKGWDFKNNWADALARKIRYIRYGHERDPLFVKFGGLSEVTLGYGIIMDRFTNMLRYPDEKLLGLQVHLNDISPAGIYLQTVISDFAEMNDKGGIFAARLAFTPLKTTAIPLLNRFILGASYAMDRNVNAPAKKWTISAEEAILKDIHDNYEDIYNDPYKELYEKHTGKDADKAMSRLAAEDSVRGCTRKFDLYGFDAGMPIIRHSLLSVDLYGQSAFRADNITGWGIGAPGVAVKLWKLNANVEYRKIEGRFTPGYFDRYYLDERYSRGLLMDKSEYIPDVSLNGVFGRMGLDVFGFLHLNGSYQYMIGKEDAKDQRYEASAGLGEQFTNRIPKIGLIEVYAKNSSIGLPVNIKFDKDGNPDKNGKLAGRFDRSPYMYWGYRAGFEITPGASLVWDYRYGWTVEGGKLVPDNFMTLQTALTF